MTIEEDFEAMREALSLLHESNPPVIHIKFEKALAALSRIEAEIERRGEQTGELLAERDALKEEHQHAVREVRRLVQAKADLGAEVERLRANPIGSAAAVRRERDALKAALEKIVATTHPAETAYEFARQALAKLGESA